MGLRIATNVQSLAAQRHLSLATASQKNSIEKIAAGSRITRAADDAAGLAISENMRATIRSVRQDVRNASDAISLVQTAEGGLNEVSNILVRFRELSIQAASDTIGDTERGFIDKEVQQLRMEMDRIANSTEFNQRKLLNGSSGKLDIQIGQRNNPDEDRFTIDMERISSTTEMLGVADINVLSKEAAQNNLDTVDKAISKVVENRSELGALQNRFQSTVNNLMIYDENLSAARSRIYDVDMASETAEYVKSNILTNAGVTVLGQANQSTNLALRLLS